MIKVWMFSDGTYFKDSPLWWQHFIDDNNLSAASVGEINRVIMRYRARFAMENSDRVLYFNSNEDKIQFLLRWG